MHRLNATNEVLMFNMFLDSQQIYVTSTDEAF